uniref:Uncharacterized protein n=1 Tax=Arundo donax TaxID=35708 RepID=A0A0A9G7U5_ARUDO
MSLTCASKPKPTRLLINNNSATFHLLFHVHHDHPMTPSATPRRTSRARRQRCHNAAAGRTLLGGATARVLAAGLWRLRHAERLQAAGHAARRYRHDDSAARACVLEASPQQGRRVSPLCHGNKRRTDQFDVGSQCQCRNRHGILDKIEACVEFPMAYGSSMEKATKWDRAYANNLDDIFGSHDPTTTWKLHHLPRSTTTHAMVAALEAELEKARAQIGELEDERRVTRKRLERFLRKLAEEKAAWKTRVREKAQHAVTALKEEARLERKHRRQLEAANEKLMRELAEARLSVKQQAKSYEMERKARELMEEACSELKREVEEDQAEVELLRRECLRLREEMEEERRMLQMAEVWREERVQMKLSDAKLALETKYSHLNRLQAEMEAFLRSKDGSCHSSALREARIISEAAAAASSSARSRRDHQNSHAHAPAEVDLDSVFEHFRRKEKEKGKEKEKEKEMSANGAASYTSASPASSNVQSVSPATDLFLAKVDDDDPYSDVSADDDGGRDSCSWIGTSDRSASVARASNASIPNNGSRGLDGSGVTEARSSGASRRSMGKNTALIRRLWRSAITESRKKTGGAPANGGGWSPSPDRRSTLTAAAPPALPVAAGQCSSSGSVVNLPIRLRGGTQQHNKQSLKEKLMEARMDDHKEKPSNAMP